MHDWTLTDEFYVTVVCAQRTPSHFVYIACKPGTCYVTLFAIRRVRLTVSGVI